MPRKKKSSVKLTWQEDADIQITVNHLITLLEMTHLRGHRIFCYRTFGSSAGAYARIWSFPKIFQSVLNIEAAYVIEVISEKFDRLSADDQIKVLIHELLHIPKNFSGTLLPHKYGKTTIDREVKVLYKMFQDKSRE
jgi:predicted metallopeptidase